MLRLRRTNAEFSDKLKMHANACDKLALVLRYAREFASLMNIVLLLRCAREFASLMNIVLLLRCARDFS